MTANIPASIFYVLVLAFFVVVALGVVLGAYAATQLRKCQEQVRASASDDQDATPTPVAVKPVAADEA